VFLVCLAGILVSGAAEITMAQWASGFLEEAMRIPKIIGDSAGVGVFALAIGIGRTVYGKMGARMNIQKAMTAGAGLTLVCYVVVVFSDVPALSLAACALSGFGVSLLWPGSLVLAAERFPLAGTSMFAVLAASGDFGAATGPWMVGLVADNALKLPAVLRFGSSGLRSGFLFAAVFPAAMLICMRYIRKHKSGTLTPTVPKG
jgi:MFS family permease